MHIVGKYVLQLLKSSVIGFFFRVSNFVKNVLFQVDFDELKLVYQIIFPSNNAAGIIVAANILVKFVNI